MPLPSEWLTTSGGALARRIKGARHSHAAVRASGRIPGAEARAAWQALTPEQRRQRKLERKRVRELAEHQRKHQHNLSSSTLDLD